MRKWICIALCAALLAGLFTGCAANDLPEHYEPTGNALEGVTEAILETEEASVITESLPILRDTVWILQINSVCRSVLSISEFTDFVSLHISI